MVGMGSVNKSNHTFLPIGRCVKDTCLERNGVNHRHTDRCGGVEEEAVLSTATSNDDDGGGSIGMEITTMKGDTYNNPPGSIYREEKAANNHQQRLSFI